MQVNRSANTDPQLQERQHRHNVGVVEPWQTGRWTAGSAEPGNAF
jgi:hypothetical protein